MAQPYTVKVLEHSHVAPPSGSVSTTIVPLTLFDVLWFFCNPIQRIFFFELPYPTLHFTETILPHLKHSLSLTVSHFFPLAAKLTCPIPPNKPYLRYNEGDSIPVTVAESDLDFNHLVGNHARENRAFQSLVPNLPTARLSPDTEQVAPVVALQITVFPNAGISIGISFNHVVADGSSINHFIKSWASIHRSGGEALASLSLPYHNRYVVKDPGEVASTNLKYLLTWDYSIESTPSEAVPQDKIRITLVLNQAQTEKLKEWIKTQSRNKKDKELGPIRISTYVVTCAFMWVNLMKLQEKLEESETGSHPFNDDKLCHFLSLADCRERYELAVPATYFGNCLAFFFVSEKRSELMGKNGIAIAAKAIAKTISGLEKGPLIGAEQWASKSWEILKVGDFVTVAGSPKLRVYETDFGWGRPKKSEVAHIGAYGAFSLSECRDEEGGIEIGLVLDRKKLDLYKEIFVQGLELEHPFSFDS
ncbi:coumaroyl-CoA:anthocyanidin 3-O-glucoside-6''-O-coumaroyltransferase 1-like [Mangifera indica]|uniref:coumaroyl-CoA:anthocyanidin 3-O-glucoside-6''-O-coumaroyltransferase 1-like n=1 Tax=Mangifera indica TaxID=29780 RepID=UPI001CF9B116|nr:coumaroyl-CoA:anthocyanidin 3-O-glucoside-6''-O-coumaroyltransferase 1-like [Mangifera indica]